MDASPARPGGAFSCPLAELAVPPENAVVTKLIFDCDPGVDDAVALFMAFAAPQDLELLAITTVAGNVGAELTTRNAALIGMAISCAAISSSKLSGIGKTISAAATKYSAHVACTLAAATR